jgi:competence protein ComEC
VQKQALSRILVIVLATIILIFVSLTNWPDNNLKISFLDIGQGDAILIETPNSQKILVDAGPATNILNPLGAKLGYFNRQIDLVILTHPDLDHIAGFSEVLRRYHVRSVLMTGVLHDSAAYGDILEQIAEQDIPVYLAEEKQDFDFGAGVTLDILWPTAPIVGHDPANNNETSIVAKLIYGKTSALLAGDAEETVEATLLKSGNNLQADILKLGHHGARTSSSTEFLAAVQPEIAIISAGADNSYGHPHPETLTRLSAKTQIYSTITNGTITLVSDGTSWEKLK